MTHVRVHQTWKMEWVSSINDNGCYSWADYDEKFMFGAHTIRTNPAHLVITSEDSVWCTIPSNYEIV